MVCKTPLLYPAALTPASSIEATKKVASFDHSSNNENQKQKQKNKRKDDDEDHERHTFKRHKPCIFYSL
jgi:hypothetical protein